MARKSIVIGFIPAGTAALAAGGWETYRFGYNASKEMREICARTETYSREETPECRAYKNGEWPWWNVWGIFS